MRMSGSMSGMWKRGTVWIMRHRQTKGPDTDRPDLNNRATSRLYSLLCLTSQQHVLGHLSEMLLYRASEATAFVTLADLSVQILFNKCIGDLAPTILSGDFALPTAVVES